MYNLTVKDVDRSGTKRGQRPCRSGGDATPARLALPAGRRAPAVFNIRYFVSNRLNMKIYIDTVPPPYRVLALDIRQADRRRFLSGRPERPSDVTARSRLSGRTGSASAAPPGSPAREHDAGLRRGPGRSRRGHSRRGARRRGCRRQFSRYRSATSASAACRRASSRSAARSACAARARSAAASARPAPAALCGGDTR